MYSFSHLSGSIILIVICGLTVLTMLFISYVLLPRRLQNAYRRSLLTLSKISEAKDAQLAGRGERIASYAVAVAKKLNLSRKERLMIEYAAYLQEIGNAGIPISLPDLINPQTEYQQDALRKHTILGAEIISHVDFLKDVAPIIKHHHENWDGSGLPDGLKGEEIPLGSRIISICAAYDSLEQPRYGESGASKEEVLQKIQAAAGKRFDPCIVQVFIAVMKEQNLD